MAIKTEVERRYEHVPITQILVDQKHQFRANLSPEVIENYASLISDGAKFPNLVVFDTGREDGLYTLVDGFQRLKGYEVNDYRKIHVDVIEGTEEQAILYALNANSTHGAAYTNDDKRKRARFCFGHKTMKNWTDNKTAKYLAVSQGFISSQRKTYNETRGIDEDSLIKHVETKDGRSYPIDVKKGADTKGNKNGGRKKIVIPEEQSQAITVDMDEVEPTQLILGDEPVENGIAQLEGAYVNSMSHSIRTSKNGLMKVTLGELDDLITLEKYDLIIYSGDLDWLINNQELITSNTNVILQGSTGEDVNKIQNVNTLANTFNLFLVAGKMTVTAYYCSQQIKIQDKVISTYDLYLAELITSYVTDGGSVLLIDPLSTVCEVMQSLMLKCHVFYSDENVARYQKELIEGSVLDLEFEDQSLEESTLSSF